MLKSRREKVGDKDKRKASNTSLLAMATLAETVYFTSSGLSEMPVWSFEWHNFAICTFMR